MHALRSPIKMGTLDLKNRFVRSATQDRMGNADGSITEKEIDLYEELAANDIGMIISSCCYVSHPAGRHGALQNALFSDRFIDGYNAVAAVVQKHGAKFIVQVSHAGRQTTPEMIGRSVPKAPSAVLNKVNGITPDELSGEEIESIILDFANAAERARKAGCDGIQLHVAHGYLLSQFLSPYTNRRKDQWGGSIDNRTRILRKILQQAKAFAGADFPILVKLNSTDGFDGPETLSLQDVVWTAKMLESIGVVGIELSGGIQETKDVIARPGIVRIEQEGYFSEAAREVRKVLQIPLVLVGGFRSVSVMEQAIIGGSADMVSLSRPFICEPDLLRRFAAGQAKAGCVSCNRCFSTEALKCYNKVQESHNC